MITAIVEIYINSTWVDITGFVLKVGDFKQILNNHDASIIIDNFQTTISYTIIDTYADIQKPIRIKQDNLIIFVGNISKIEIPNFETYEITCTIESVTAKLKQKIQESVYKTALETAIGTGSNLLINGFTLHGYVVKTLLSHIFLTLTGYELDTSYLREHQVAQSSGASAFYPPLICKEMLWNAGLDKVYHIESLRSIDDLALWIDLFNIVCRIGNVLIWDISQQKFILTGTGFISNVGVESNSYALDIPANSAIWKFAEQDANLNKRYSSEFEKCSNTNAYLQDIAQPAILGFTAASASAYTVSYTKITLNNVVSLTVGMSITLYVGYDTYDCNIIYITGSEIGVSKPWTSSQAGFIFSPSGVKTFTATSAYVIPLTNLTVNFGALYKAGDIVEIGTGIYAGSWVVGSSNGIDTISINATYSETSSSIIHNVTNDDTFNVELDQDYVLTETNTTTKETDSFDSIKNIWFVYRPYNGTVESFFTTTKFFSWFQFIRFYGIYNVEKYTIDFKTDNFRNMTDAQAYGAVYKNISGAKAVNIGNRYFTELEFFEVKA